MSVKKWPRVVITTRDGEEKSAIAPTIISASRSTDIPAFYGEWFIRRLDAGYAVWNNPWNGKSMYVSFEQTRCIVFWTKNPAPFLDRLHDIDRRGMHFYFHFTLNDYEAEGLEGGVPPLEERIETFKRLAEMIGSERIIWRFDPLIITHTLPVERRVERIWRIGRSLSGSTGQLTFSFLTRYAKVERNMGKAGIVLLPWLASGKELVARSLAELGKQFGMRVVTCALEDSFDNFAICHGKCIDDDLLVRLFPLDPERMGFLGVRRKLALDAGQSNSVDSRGLKDKGQRAHCKCTASKDIGSYSTCGHKCVYCYANTSPSRAYETCLNARIDSESIT